MTTSSVGWYETETDGILPVHKIHKKVFLHTFCKIKGYTENNLATLHSNIISQCNT
jgi:Leu/Phe-tRNA-protein transferase